MEDENNKPEVISTKVNYVDIAKIITNVFLIVVIALLLWQFYSADKMTKDLALSNDPIEIIRLYENITGYDCMCGVNIENRFNEAINKNRTIKDYTIPKLNLTLTQP
jgi:hypothetical protein